MRIWQTIIALGMAALTAGPALSWTFSQQQSGSEAHATVLARMGGAYESMRLSQYINAVGARLAAGTTQSADTWTFTVTDNDALEARAHPGGYVYVSRGVLAILMSEAELAAVLAHQMAHSLENHVSLDRTLVGAEALAPGAVLDGLLGGGPLGEASVTPAVRAWGNPPSYTDDQQRTAAETALRLLAEAQYPADAALDLFDRLTDLAENGEAVGLAGITAEAAANDQKRDAMRGALAGLSQPADLRSSQERFLNRITGLTYGQSPRMGFVRDGQFIHPQLQFAFTLPPGFSVRITTAEVVASGPNGAEMILDVTDETAIRLQSYVRDKWAPSLTREVEAGYLYDLQARQINGFPAASAFQPFEDDRGAKIAQLVAIRHTDRVYRFRSIAPVEDFDGSLAMEAAINSFRAVTQLEASALRPYALVTHRVRRGDTMNMMAAAMPGSDAATREAEFRRLNGLSGRKVMLIDSFVKLVTEAPDSLARGIQ